ncbi:hypothetical protein [Phytohabitans kaempferiae]|uniref:Uncharacterized protein n=1 Tax=Phytohabitans kaempferiae TaxID=1620943 RepID=A0ABV6LXY5_9ACTN
MSGGCECLHQVTDQQDVVVGRGHARHGVTARHAAGETGRLTDRSVGFDAATSPPGTAPAPGAYPFLWTDEVEEFLVAAHHVQPALLHRVDPYLGLTDADVAAVQQWLEQHEEAG